MNVEDIIKELKPVSELQKEEVRKERAKLAGIKTKEEIEKELEEERLAKE